MHTVQSFHARVPLGSHQACDRRVKTTKTLLRNMLHEQGINGVITVEHCGCSQPCATPIMMRLNDLADEMRSFGNDQDDFDDFDLLDPVDSNEEVDTKTNSPQPKDDVNLLQNAGTESEHVSIPVDTDAVALEEVESEMNTSH